MKYVLRILYCFSFFFYLEASSLQKQPSKEHWVIIHGTFARAIPLKWWEKNGSAQKALASYFSKKSKSIAIHSFVWSSENNHPARQKAAKELIEFLKSLNLKNDETIHLIAHSHGGTVALLAAQLITEQKTSLHIAELFNLGTPVHANWYPNAFKAIGTIYHLFSYGDMIQPVAAIFQRTLPDWPNVHNLQITRNYESPRHDQLRDPELIEHLPYIPELITEAGVYCLHLDTKKSLLTIRPDTTRKKDLEMDQASLRQIMSWYGDCRSKLQSLSNIEKEDSL